MTERNILIKHIFDAGSNMRVRSFGGEDEKLMRRFWDIILMGYEAKRDNLIELMDIILGHHYTTFTAHLAFQNQVYEKLLKYDIELLRKNASAKEVERLLLEFKDGKEELCTSIRDVYKQSKRLNYARYIEPALNNPHNPELPAPGKILESLFNITVGWDFLLHEYAWTYKKIEKTKAYDLQEMTLQLIRYYLLSSTVKFLNENVETVSTMGFHNAKSVSEGVRYLDMLFSPLYRISPKNYNELIVYQLRVNGKTPKRGSVLRAIKRLRKENYGPKR